MVEALGPSKFYGSSLPRPRFYKPNEERVNPPLPVLDPFMSWAEEAHWSMGGVSFTRHRLQGRIEGNIGKLRAEREHVEKKAGEKSPRNGSPLLPDSPSLPPAPFALKRKRRLVDETDCSSKGLARKLGDEFDKLAEESGADQVVAVGCTRSRRNEAVVAVAKKVKFDAEKLKKRVKSDDMVGSGTRTSPRLSKP